MRGLAEAVSAALTVDVLPDGTEAAHHPVLLPPDPAARYLPQLAGGARGRSRAFRSPGIPQQVQVPEFPVVPLAHPAQQHLALFHAAYPEAGGGGDGPAVQPFRSASPLLSTQSRTAVGTVARLHHVLLF